MSQIEILSFREKQINKTLSASLDIALGKLNQVFMGLGVYSVLWTMRNFSALMEKKKKEGPRTMARVEHVPHFSECWK